MSEAFAEERLGLLLRDCRPAPVGWVSAAKAYPEVRAALAAIDRRVLDGAVDRAERTAAMERALRDAAVEPSPERIMALQRLLDSPA